MALEIRADAVGGGRIGLGGELDDWIGCNSLAVFANSVKATCGAGTAGFKPTWIVQNVVISAELPPISMTFELGMGAIGWSGSAGWGRSGAARNAATAGSR